MSVFVVRILANYILQAGQIPSPVHQRDRGRVCTRVVPTATSGGVLTGGLAQNRAAEERARTVSHVLALSRKNGKEDDWGTIM